MKTLNIPLIKEDRVDKIIVSLTCIDNHKFDRKSQMECVLSLYPRAVASMRDPKTFAKYEKGIFRGMIITTLGMLGLIINRGKFILPSENGILLVHGNKSPREERELVIQAVFLEIDSELFGFVDQESEKEANILGAKISNIDLEEDSRLRERIIRWTRLLKSTELITKNIRGYSINQTALNKVRKMKEKIYGMTEEFSGTLFENYRKLARNTSGIVDIEELRIHVAGEFLQEYGLAITKNVFDNMLTKLPLETRNYKISFGQPMGKGEKLYLRGRNYYRTIYISKMEV